MLAGLLYGPGFVATFGVRQQEASRWLHGQVFTTATSLKTGAFGLGAAASGAAVAWLGATGTILVAAGTQAVAVALGSIALARPERTRSDH